MRWPQGKDDHGGGGHGARKGQQSGAATVLCGVEHCGNSPREIACDWPCRSPVVPALSTFAGQATPAGRRSPSALHSRSRRRHRRARPPGTVAARRSTPAGETNSTLRPHELLTELPSRHVARAPVRERRHIEAPPHPNRGHRQVKRSTGAKNRTSGVLGSLREAGSRPGDERRARRQAIELVAAFRAKATRCDGADAASRDWLRAAAGTSMSRQSKRSGSAPAMTERGSYSQPQPSLRRYERTARHAVLVEQP